MNHYDSEPLRPQIPNYLIKINTTAFHPKKCNLLQRTKQICLPKYWNKFHMDQKRISQSSEDRLIELTTGQIDRIIDLQKIHTSLSSKKKKAKQRFFDFKPKNVNNHSNTYQACFLAKINQIAIKKNIRHQSADIGVYVGEDANASNKKVKPVAFKYKKNYDLDNPLKMRRKTYHAEDDDQKSISSIHDDLDQFEKKIQETRNEGNSLRVTNISQGSLRSRTKTGNPLAVKKKWFHGLSKMLLEQHEQKTQIEQLPEKQILGRQISIDIQSRMTPAPAPYNYSLKQKLNQKSLSTQIDPSQISYQKRYRPHRLKTQQ